MPLAGDKDYIMGNSRQDNSLHLYVKTTMQTTNNLTWESGHGFRGNVGAEGCAPISSYFSGT